MERTVASQQTENRRPATLLVNPAAGQGRFVRNGEWTWRLSHIVDVLARRYAMSVELTEGPGAASAQARAAGQAGAHAVFALGGDGTLRECAEGLFGTPVPLGLLAGGTTNVLVRSLGLPVNALEAAEAYAPGPFDEQVTRPAVRPLDVGLCGDKPFLMMMSRGLDGRALESVSTGLKRRFGKAAVALSAAQEFVRRPEQYFDVETDQGMHQSTFIGVCNVPHYGGNFRLAPQASPFDRHLDLVSLTSFGRLRTARFAAAVLGGRAGKMTDVTTERLRRATLQGVGQALIQLDGDHLTVELPLEISVAKERLLLVWPR